MPTSPRSSQAHWPSASLMPLTCEQIVRQASDFIDAALPATECGAVEDHLKTCDSCSCHLSQLRTTIDLLAKRPGLVPEGLRQALDEAARGVDSRVATSAGNAVGEHGPRLLALARALDDEAAEDLVQATWERALIEGPGAFTYQRLVEILLGAADSGRGNLSIDDVSPSAGDGQFLELDPDADTAEVFYPHFYGDGPDAGSWVQPPRSWPSETILSPEDDLTTTELYDVVDAAISQVGGDGARLLALVDMGGLDSGRAAELLGLEESAARFVLHAARNQVRAALDDYLETSQA